MRDYSCLLLLAALLCVRINLSLTQGEYCILVGNMSAFFVITLERCEYIFELVSGYS